MPEKQKRRLAAIMFTDIAGYTAIMQENEAAAAVLRQRHREVFLTEHEKYHGEVLQYYGDGTLSIFKSAVEAVECAIAMQQQFQTGQVVPLRIGIHLGDIVFDESDVYGDGVNLASRIESLGIPGCILLSDKLNFAVKSHSRINTKSVGHFEFKNIKDPVEVFAITNSGITVPERSALKGKLRENTKSIAVLPFVNMSSDPENEYFSDGISEEILNVLAKLNSLQVTARTSSFAFKGKNMDVREIGAQLGVLNILEGSVRKAGNRVRVTAQLVSTVDGYHFFSETYDRDLEDIFAIQDDIAQNIVEKLELTLLNEQENKPLILQPTQNMDAYHWYLRGRYFVDQRVNVELAMSCFEKALELDPNYALAHSGMGYAYFYQMVIANRPPTILLKAKASAQRAKELDPTIVEPYLIEGVTYFYYHWDNAKALEQYEKALALNTNSYDAYRVKAYYHSLAGDLDLAIDLAKKAVELDPLNMSSQLSLGEILYRARRFSDAVRELEKLNADFPGNKVANILLGCCYYHLDQKEKAEAYMGTVGSDAKENSFYLTARLLYYVETGRPGEALETVKNYEQGNLSYWVSPACLALLYFGIGNNVKASEHLQKALDARDPILKIAVAEPFWDKYRSSQVVQDTLKKMTII